MSIQKKKTKLSPYRRDLLSELLGCMAIATTGNTEFEIRSPDNKLLGIVEAPDRVDAEKQARHMFGSLDITILHA